MIRIAREVTGRPKILVHNHCYHGSVDETVVTLETRARSTPARATSARRSTRPTTRVVEINDLEALERELAHGDVACVLVEPALTNIGIVLAEDGYHERLRELTRETGTLLVIDETHTLCCGPGGYTRAHGLEPDLPHDRQADRRRGAGRRLRVHRGGGRERIIENTIWEAADVGGVGGTLAGNALSLAAVRATLGEVLTDDAFERMIALGERFESAVAATIAEHGLPWSVTRLGCRAEYMFAPEPAGTGAEAAAALRPRARRAAAPLHAQPRRPDDAFPHDGPDVPGDGRTTSTATEAFAEAAAELAGKPRTPPRAAAPPARC